MAQSHGSCCDFFRLKLRFGLWLFFGLRVFRFLFRLFLHEQYGFLFLNSLVSFLVHLIMSVFDSGEFFGHMLLGEVKQEGGNGVIAVCDLELGNQEIPADNGFLLGGEICDDVHFLLVREVVIRFFSLKTDLGKVLLAE